MWFNVGIGEVGVICMLAVLAAALSVLRYRAWSWALVAAFCALVAAIFSPADPFSTVILGSVLFAFFLCGTRFGRFRTLTAS